MSVRSFAFIAPRHYTVLLLCLFSLELLSDPFIHTGCSYLCCIVGGAVMRELLWLFAVAAEVVYCYPGRYRGLHERQVFTSTNGSAINSSFPTGSSPTGFLPTSFLPTGSLTTDSPTTDSSTPNIPSCNRTAHPPSTPVEDETEPINMESLPFNPSVFFADFFWSRI
jgi:hypothetical protein